MAQVSISGKVVDASTRRPVAGVNIRVDKSMQKSVTNALGEFSINGLSDEKHVLSFTHVSYEPQSKTIEGSDSQIVISLNESHVNIGQVVVTGTGTHHRLKDSPVPVHVITQQEIANTNATSLEEA